MQLKVYIAGKISGDENYKGKFGLAEKFLEEKGDTVFSPAHLPEGMSKNEYMKICFTMIDSADVVYFLPDSDESVGAMLEKAYCDYTGKSYIGKWSKIKHENAV